MEKVVSELSEIIPTCFDPAHRNPSWLNAQGQRRCLPYFYILGMPKCATTAIFNQLIRHPHIFCGSNQVKEPYFWSRGAHFVQNGCTIQQYMQNFDEFAQHMRPDWITGEASVQTFWERNVASLLAHFQPDAKLIVIFRNPLGRAHSEFRYMHPTATAEQIDDLMHRELDVAEKYTDVQAEALCRNDPLLKGMFCTYLPTWLANFSPAQLLILSFEHYCSKPRECLHLIFKFLGVPPPTRSQWKRILASKESNKSVNQVPMSAELAQRVQAFYTPFNQDLYQTMKKYKGPRSPISDFDYNAKK
jgi:N-acetylgalactosamine 4-sulfate 6-O-sulfotransferase